MADLKNLTDFQLQEKYKECVKKISNMTANIEVVMLLADIEKELSARGKDGNIQKCSN